MSNLTDPVVLAALIALVGTVVTAGSTVLVMNRNRKKQSTRSQDAEVVAMTVDSRVTKELVDVLHKLSSVNRELASQTAARTLVQKDLASTTEKLVTSVIGLHEEVRELRSEIRVQGDSIKRLS